MLVVCGHLDIFKWFAYLFHVPLFFFCAGYVADTRCNWTTYVKQKIKNYYVPFIFYEIIFLCLHNVFYPIFLYEKYNGKDCVRNLLKIFLFQNVGNRLGQLWFLFALFIVSVLFFIINKTHNISGGGNMRCNVDYTSLFFKRTCCNSLGNMRYL